MENTDRFTKGNTYGFTQGELNLVNEAISIVRSRLIGVALPENQADKLASDIVFCRWMAEGNTIETLTAY